MLSVGAALLGYGLPAHRIEESLLRLSRALSRDITVFALPTAIVLTVRTALGSDSHFVRAVPGTIDLGRLAMLHQLVGRVERRELSADEAASFVASALEAPRVYPRWLDVLAVVLVTVGGGLMIGIPIHEAPLCVAPGLVIGTLLWLSSRVPSLTQVVPIVGALLAALTSTLLHGAGLTHNWLALTLSAVLVLLPGLTLTLSMTELASGHLVSGTSRGVGALFVFLQLGFGVLLSAKIVGSVDDVLLLGGRANPMSVWLGALLLAAGFAELFAVGRDDAVATFVVCGLAFGSVRLLGPLIGAVLATCVAAFASGALSHAYARLRDAPSSSLSLPAAVMLVPGGLGMLSVSAAATHDATRALDVGFQMLMVGVALSTGFWLAAALLPPRTSL
jgi:uncharacterized membrane protein YjjP (DUF1212 family)